MRLIQIAWTLVLIAAAAVAAGLLHRAGETRLAGAAVAIDGDSLRLAGRELRLHGIDAPELRQTCRSGGEERPCGRDARTALTALLARGPIVCVLSGHDRFGRDLAACRVGETDVNATLVRDGQAVALGAYVGEEAAARAGRRGIWATEFQRPADWRRAHPRAPDVPL
jgi:endonuclease YncB( thermonuclease family)